MPQADLTFVIFTITVVGVVDVDTENMWTTLISKFDLALEVKKQRAMGVKMTLYQRDLWLSGNSKLARCFSVYT